MARIGGIDIPNNKRIVIALTYIFGIGPTTAATILEKTHIDVNTRVAALSESELTKLRQEVSKIKIEGELRREHRMNIKRLMEIGSYRGRRHRKNLPVRGQSTRQNARTAKRSKGPRQTIANKKKVHK